MTVASLTANQLRQEYAALTATGSLGGAATLYQFERMRWELASQGNDLTKPVAFTLAAVFEFLGRRQDGVPVTFEQAQLVYSFLNQPIVACLDFLAGRDPVANPLQLIGGIAAAYDRYRQVS